jgi:anti-sigma B factor antagonist
MNYITENLENCSVILSKVDKLDATNASELKSELVLLNKQGVNNMILDLSHTKYCDSSGLSSILIANRLCKDSSGVFILCGLQSSVSKLIAIAQLDRVLVITETREEAQSKMTELHSAS